MLSDLTHQGRKLDRAVTAAHWHALREGGTAALRAFAQDLDAFTAQFPRYAEALRRLAAPAAIIWGADDPVLRPERLLPGFTQDLRIRPDDVHVLDHASHFLQEDRPDDIADLVRRIVSHS